MSVDSQTVCGVHPLAADGTNPILNLEDIDAQINNAYPRTRSKKTYRGKRTVALVFLLWIIFGVIASIASSGTFDNKKGEFVHRCGPPCCGINYHGPPCTKCCSKGF